MANVTKIFGLVRLVILATVSLFSALVLIMAALVTSFSTSVLRGYFVYAAFAIAISGLTLLTVPVMLFISLTRKGAFPSMIVVELGYFGLLWVLWLAVGGNVANISWINYCSSIGFYYRGYEAACMETQAMAAFAFLNWLLLLALNAFLLTLAIIQANRGNSGIWNSCVTDVDYSTPAAISSTTEPKVAYGGPAFPGPPIPQQSVPSPQQAYPPQQVYTPPPQEAYPPQQVYTPPPQGYTPPPQGYSPPPQGYSPPVQGYSPPPQQPAMPMAAQV